MHILSSVLRGGAMFAALCIVSLAARAQIAVIVNPKSGASGLTTDQIGSLYLGKASSLPGGISQPLDLAESSPARQPFYTLSTGKTAAQVKATWARLAFSGKATPPKEMTSSAEVKKFVVSNADAIGYIEKSAVDSSVKVLLTLEP